jgi:hypothetical protein
MSLINDALKRAEAEKGPANPFASCRLPSMTGIEPTPGAEQAKQSPGPAVGEPAKDARPARSSCQGRSAMLMAVMVLAALAGASYFAMKGRHTPQQAKAATPAAGTAKMAPTARPAVNAQNVAKPAGGQLLPDLQQPQEQAQVAAGPEPKLESEPATAEPSANGPTAARAVRGTGEAQPAPAAEKPKPAYQLSAILQSSDGGKVLINNQLVGVGDEVDKATVVKIDPSGVILQKDGARITLRL